jgi:chaperonin GroES
MAKDTLAGFLEAPNSNIVDMVENADGIGQQAVEEFMEDVQDRRYVAKKRCWDEGQKLVQMTDEQKQFPFTNAANIKYPLLTNSAVQFSSRAYPSIVQGNSVVRPKMVGDDPFIHQKKEVEQQVEQIQQAQMPEEQKQQLLMPIIQQAQQIDQMIGSKLRKAENVSEFINWQLFNEFTEWEEDTDKLLLRLPLYGTMFRCVYYSEAKRRICTEILDPSELVVPCDTQSLPDARRVSKVFKLAPRHIQERIRSGMYADVDLDLDDEDREEPETFIEQLRYIDLDGDGYKEPYLVTVHVDSQRVVRISPNFRMEDVYENEETGEISRIKPVQYYVKYTFIPSTDDCFYDIGFFDILLPVNKVVNTTLNQLMDAGTKQIAGGGFISRDLGLRKKGPITFEPGEFKSVANPGEDIRKSVMPMDFSGPSSTMFQLLGFMVDAGRDIGNLKEVLEGQSEREMTATTTMALIEQGLKVFSGIYKRILRSLAKELQLIRFWNYEIRNPLYATVLDKRLDAEDFSDEDLDFVPVADPSVTTDMQKAARVDFVKEWVNDPYFDQWKLRQRIWEGANMDGIDDLQAGQNPEVKQLQEQLQQMQQMMQQMQQQLQDKSREEKMDALKMEGDQIAQEAAAVKNEALAIKALADAEAAEEGTQLDKYKAEAESLGADRRVGGVAGKPGNTPNQGKAGGQGGGVQPGQAGPPSRGV